MMAKIDEPGLGRVEVEPVPAKPLAQHAENTLGLFEIRENQDAIVGIPHKNAVTPEARSYVPLEPLVQHVVQVDVRKQWRDDSALRGSLSGRVVQAAALMWATRPRCPSWPQFHFYAARSRRSTRSLDPKLSPISYAVFCLKTKK